MKNKYIKIISLLIALSLISVGCGKEESNANVNKESVASETTVYETKADDRQISGEVVSITGNEVTIETGELTEDKSKPDFDGEMPEGGFNGEKPDFSGEMPEGGFNGERPDFSGEMPEGGFNGERPDFSGEMPEGGFNGEMPDFNGEMPEGGFSGKTPRKKSDVSITKSGETSTYIIPVGMTVSGLSGRKSDYSGISVGDIITITINADNEVAAVSVN